MFYVTSSDLIITESLLHLTNLSLFLPIPSRWKSPFCFLFLQVQLCCCSVAKSCPTLCNPMDCSTPGFPVLHYVLEFAPSHAHWVGEVMPSKNISSSVTPFSSCLQSFPVPGSFPRSWFFALDAQSLGASASASGLSMNIQGWFPLGLTGLILLSKGLSRIFSSTTIWKHPFFGA